MNPGEERRSVSGNIPGYADIMEKVKLDLIEGTGNGSCEFDATKPIAMAYVPWQSFTAVYEPEVALERGTIFKQLDLPYLGKKVSD